MLEGGGVEGCESAVGLGPDVADVDVEEDLDRVGIQEEVEDELGAAVKEECRGSVEGAEEEEEDLGKDGERGDLDSE